MKHVTDARKRMSRAELQRRTVAALLDAAIELFIERGVDATSIEEVTARAGYSRGAFYSNFASKDELFLAASRHFFRGLSAAARSDLQDGDDPVADAQRRTRNLRTFFDNTAAVFIAELCLYAFRHPELREETAAIHREQLEGAIRYIEEVVVAAGRSATDLPVSTSVIAQLMQATIFALHLGEFVDPDALSAEDGAATFSRLMFRGLS